MTVSKVEIVPPEVCSRKQDDHLSVHDPLCDILRGFYDYEDLAVQLREGFYSVACDYWLGWYLQWPYFQKQVPQDVFRPYFELWERGCEVAFREDSLDIAKPPNQSLRQTGTVDGIFRC
jgi:hypothetical protein